MAWRGELPRTALLPYIAAQLFGAILGAWLAHAMFDLAVLQFSTKMRTGTGQWIAEAVATAGLLLVILRAPAGRAAAMVASYIGARPTGSLHPRPSPIRPLSSVACSATALLASRLPALPASCWPSWWEQRSASPSTTPSSRGSIRLGIPT